MRRLIAFFILWAPAWLSRVPSTPPGLPADPNPNSTGGGSPCTSGTNREAYWSWRWDFGKRGRFQARNRRGSGRLARGLGRAAMADPEESKSASEIGNQAGASISARRT
jgi:hypothetical protein